MNEILQLMENGQWAEAIEKFRKINISGREFGEILDEIDDEELRDLALLGFYARKVEL